jgi:hypothetical protein
VGNPQQLGQQPIKFNRQVTSLVAAPFLLDHPSVTSMFPKDAIERARKLVKMFGGTIGAYTDSRGNAGVRQVRRGGGPDCGAAFEQLCTHSWGGRRRFQGGCGAYGLGSWEAAGGPTGGSACGVQEVADFIKQRDGYPSNPEHIFLTGAPGAHTAAPLALLAHSLRCNPLDLDKLPNVVTLPQCRRRERGGAPAAECAHP